jgi:hypothetical protein
MLCLSRIYKLIVCLREYIIFFINEKDPKPVIVFPECKNEILNTLVIIVHLNENPNLNSDFIKKEG